MVQKCRGRGKDELSLARRFVFVRGRVREPGGGTTKQEGDHSRGLAAAASPPPQACASPQPGNRAEP